jgi:1,2-diacylglycerol 3-beta-glucosyltransferase
VGLRRSYQQAEDRAGAREQRAVSVGTLIAHTAIGSLFILHWLVVMPLAIARMAILPKRLKWVKTLRQADL